MLLQHVNHFKSGGINLFIIHSCITLFMKKFIHVCTKLYTFLFFFFLMPFSFWVSQRLKCHTVNTFKQRSDIDQVWANLFKSLKMTAKTHDLILPSGIMPQAYIAIYYGGTAKQCVSIASIFDALNSFWEHIVVWAWLGLGRLLHSPGWN